MVNEALWQALELQAVLVAARPYDKNGNTYQKYRSLSTQQRDAQQLRCKIWGFHGGDYEESSLLGCGTV
jgi:hypothetical protein